MPYDAERADRAVKFIEEMPHVKGRQWVGDNISLMPWQEQVIRDLFGTVTEEGTRQFRYAYLEIGRKNGKSVLCAAIGLCLLVMDREPGAEIYLAARDRDQAGIIFKMAMNMVKKKPELEEVLEITEYKKKIESRVEMGSVLKAISRDSHKAHGYDSHGVIFDEVHVQQDRQMWDALETSMGAREEPLMIGITTAGYDRESLCWDLHEYTQDVNAGKVEDDSFYGAIWSYNEASFPPHWYDPDHPSHPEDWEGRPQRWEVDPDEVAWHEIEALEAANPSIEREAGTGFRKRREILDLRNRAREVIAHRARFKRLYLNIWTTAQDYFIDPEKWDACRDDFTEKDLMGQKCWAGLDLASKTDLASFSLVFPGEDVYRVLCYHFCPEGMVNDRSISQGIPYIEWAEDGFINATPGNSIDYREIYETILRCNDNFDIMQINFDKFGAVQIMQDIEDLGAEAVEFTQTYEYYSEPMKDLHARIHDRKIRHNGDPVLAWQMGNLVKMEDHKDNWKPTRKGSKDKIDGVVATIMALDGANRQETTKTKSIYEDRGPLIIGK